jgi:hypothetical protein
LHTAGRRLAPVNERVCLRGGAIGRSPRLQPPMTLFSRIGFPSAASHQHFAGAFRQIVDARSGRWSVGSLGRGSITSAGWPGGELMNFAKVVRASAIVRRRLYYLNHRPTIDPGRLLKDDRPADLWSTFRPGGTWAVSLTCRHMNCRLIPLGTPLVRGALSPTPSVPDTVTWHLSSSQRGWFALALQW